MNRIKILLFQLMIVVCPFIKAGNYSSQKLIYYSADKSLHFGATLTIPEKVKKPAVVVLVTGTYPQDRDCVMAGHKMFAEIADYLSSRGIAVLRSDDRGVGESNGVYETSTTADFADDVLSAVAYLKTRKDINVHKIGLLGHSEGGAVISIAASKSKDVAFMISMAGLATGGLASLIRQNEDLVNAANIPDYDKKRSNDINNRMFQVAYKYADSDSLEAKLNETYKAWKVEDDAYFKTLNIEFDHFRFPIYSYVNQAKGAWYRFFIRYNPAIYLSKVNIPVLALNGEKDVMVACKPSLDNWKRYLSHNKDVTIVPLPGLNHLFLPCTKGTPDEYVTIKAPISKDALEIIYRWIKKRI